MVHTAIRKAFGAVAIEMVVNMSPWTTWLSWTLWFMEILDCSYYWCLFFLS